MLQDLIEGITSRGWYSRCYQCSHRTSLLYIIAGTAQGNFSITSPLLSPYPRVPRNSERTNFIVIKWLGSRGRWLVLNTTDKADLL